MEEGEQQSAAASELPGEVEVPSGPLEERFVSKNWAFRVSAYEELAKLCEAAEGEQDPVFETWQSSLKKAVSDSHATAQEKAVVLLGSYLSKCPLAAAAALVGPVCKILVDKCLGAARPNTRAAAQEAFLQFVECEQVAGVMEALLLGCKSKLPKVVSGSAATLKAIVATFGARVLPIKDVVKALSPLFEHTNPDVRGEAKGIACELYKWVGEALRPNFEGLRSAQQTELFEAFNELTAGSQKPTRYLRSQRPKAGAESDKVPAAAAGAGGARGGAVAAAAADGMIDPLDLVDPVDVLAKLPKNWASSVLTLAKWQEKKELLDQLVTLASCPKIIPNNYSDVCTSLRRLLNDSMIVVVSTSVKCLGLLATGLKKEFTQQAKLSYAPLLDKLKDKNKPLVDAVHVAMDAIITHCLTITDMQEELVGIIACKVPKSKVECSIFIGRYLQTKPAGVTLKSVKPIWDATAKNLDDGAPEVREAALTLLTGMHECFGPAATKPLLATIDPKKAEKISSAGGAAETRAPAATASSRPATAPARPASAKLTSEPTLSSTRSAAAGTTTTKRPTTAGAKKKPAGDDASASAGGGSSEPALPSISSDQLAAIWEENVPSDIRANLLDKNWAKRFEGMGALVNWVSTSASLLTGHGSEAVISGIANIAPGWKESNVQVVARMFNFVTAVLSAGNDTPKRCLPSVVEAACAKIGDLKVRAAAGEALMTCCEAFGPITVVDQIVPLLAKEKNPKSLQFSAEWLESCVVAFGIGPHLQPKSFIECCKSTLLENANPAVRTAAIKILVTLRRAVGQSLMTVLESLKPALIAQIDAEFAKVADAGPLDPPTKFVRSSSTAAGATAAKGKGGRGGPAAAAAAAAAVIDLVERTDISGTVAPFLKDMGDANWKVRDEALTSVSQAIQDANRCITPNVGDLIASLKLRLKDTNKNLVVKALAIIGTLGTAVGAPIEQHIKSVVPTMLLCTTDNKANVRSAVSLALDEWAVHCRDRLLSNFVAALTVDSPQGRKEVLDWLVKHISLVTTPSELPQLIKPVLDSIGYRTADVRASAELALIELGRKSGVESIRRETRSWKPTQLSTIAPILDKIEKEVVPAPAPTPVVATASRTAPVALAAAPQPSVVDLDKENIQPGARGLTRPTTAAAPPTRSASEESLLHPAPVSASAPVSSLPHGYPFISTGEAKAKRAARLVKWNPPETPAVAADGLQELRPFFSAGIAEDCLAKLMSTDFKKQLEGIGELQTAAQTCPTELGYAFDLATRYSALRLYESTNTSVLLRIVDFLECSLNTLSSSDQKLTESEATILLQCFAEKTGHNNESVKNKVRGLIKLVYAVFPASRSFAILADAVDKTNNHKAKKECIEELTSLIERLGIDVSQPAKTLPLMGHCIAGRDVATRQAALALVVVAHERLGADKTWKMLGAIPESAKGMILDKLKTAKKREEAAAASQPQASQVSVPESAAAFIASKTPSLATTSFTYSTQPTPISVPSNPVFKDLLEGPTPRLPSRPTTSSGASTVPASAPIVAPSAYSSERSASALAAARTHIAQLDSSREEDSIVTTLKTICAELLETKSGYLDNVDELVSRLTTLVHFSFTKDPIPIRLCKHVLNTVMQIFIQPELATRLSETALSGMIEELLERMADETGPTVPDADEQSLLQNAMNLLLMKILDTADTNKLFTVLLLLLYQHQEIRHVQPTFNQSVLRCMLKLTRGLENTIQDLNIDQLLMDIHQFLTAHPPSKYRGQDFVPLRLLKTVLNELVKLKGEAIRSHLTLVPAGNTPTVVSYINLSLKSLHSSAAAAPTQDPSTAPSTLSSDQRAQLTDIFEKIGVRTTTKPGILALHNFKKEFPNVDLTPWMSSTSPDLRQYITKHLQRCTEHDLRASSGEALPAGHYETKLQELQSRVGLVSAAASASSSAHVLNAPSVPANEILRQDAPRFPQRPTHLSERPSLLSLANIDAANSTASAPAKPIETVGISSTQFSLSNLQERLAKIKAQQSE